MNNKQCFYDLDYFLLSVFQQVLSNINYSMVNVDSFFPKACHPAALKPESPKII